MLILLRGLPTSNKTEVAQAISDQYPVYHIEADMFFDEGDKKVPFNPKATIPAHMWCLQQAVGALMSGCDVIVSNTFAKRKHMLPYIRSAEELGHEVIIETATEMAENPKNVPDRIIDKLIEEWEE